MDESKLPQNVEILYETLEPQTLRNLVQECIGREDATYYEVRPEMTMEEKIDVVIGQLSRGDASILWNTNLESGKIVLKKDTI